MNAGLLFYFLRKNDVYKPQAGWFMFMSKLAVAVIAMAVALHFAAGSDAVWLAYKLLPKMMHLLGLLVLGSAVYFLALWLMGIRAKDFIRRSVI
jgi:putative peptidoglycan lipid II flippase